MLYTGGEFLHREVFRVYFTFASILEAGILASSLSLDAFTAGFAYGSKRIKIPMLSVQIINLICSAITGLSLFAGAVLRPYLPRWLTLGVAFSILFIIGVSKLMDSMTKHWIRKHDHPNRDPSAGLFNFNFILNLYADPENADADFSKVISPTEAAVLALSLSLDGMAVGFGAAFANVNVLAVFLWSLITDATLLLLGHFIGAKLARKLPFNISWLSGVVLIGLAFSKII